jgi:integrase
MMIDVKTGKAIHRGASTETRRPGSIPTGGPGTAGQCVALISTLMVFAIARKLRSDNPAAGIKKPPIRKMERFLSEEEIARLARALDADAAASGNPYPAAAIKLLLLSGARRGEIANLQWQNVDFQRKCLRLPDSKTGAKVIYLNEPAVDILRSLPRLANNLFVIPGDRVGAPCGAIDRVWSRARSVAGLRDVRLHDLRHSFASIGVVDMPTSRPARYGQRTRPSVPESRPQWE